jgi:hypothetical protein
MNAQDERDSMSWMSDNAPDANAWPLLESGT